MSFLDKSPAEEWDALSKKRRAEARRVNEELTAEKKAAEHTLGEILDKQRKERKIDIVDNPEHYTGGGIECIDYIKERLTPDEFQGFLNGNVIKYTHRWKEKNGIEDLRKARWYLNRLIQEQCNG